MDFAKLIEQRDQFVADAATTLERRGIDPSAIKNPVDVQAEQAKRVRERIDSLEARKADLVASIDTELAELKRDFKGRDQKDRRPAKARRPPPPGPRQSRSRAHRQPGPGQTRKASLSASPAPAKARTAA